MELEFDKEIDGILRKARGGGTAAGAAPAGQMHADADTIAAFAENVLPQKAKLLYMEHFADCDRCRRMLSQTILLSNEAVTANAGAASGALPVVSETAVPWYQKLFKTQNLALAMGALVIGFSGLLGYLVFQRQGLGPITVSQVANKERSPGGPNAGSEPEAMQSENTAAANLSTSNAMANKPMMPVSTPSANTTVSMMDRPEQTPTGGVLTEITSGDNKDNAPKTTAAPPPAPVILDGIPAARERERDGYKLEDKDRSKELPADLELAKRKNSDEMRSRDMPPSKGVGPSRSAGPVQNQSNQINNNVFDMSVTRIVSGKTFNNRERAWYDSTYRGQATVNIRRGTDEFKKLDSGLRNIANTLGGTVVVVWKDKAYRIQ